jgi:hypothetical protein
MHFQLNCYANRLCRLCAQWQARVRSIQPAYPMPSKWGPSEGELADAVIANVSAGWNEESNDDNELYPESDEERDRGDDELVELIESVAQADAYRDHESDFPV